LDSARLFCVEETLSSAKLLLDEEEELFDLIEEEDLQWSGELLVRLLGEPTVVSWSSVE
jgi:hypothetical protein